MKDNRITLAGDDLFKLNDECDYKGISIDYSDSLDVIGVATKNEGSLQYYVYRNGERGSVEWEYRCETFSRALEEARTKYKRLQVLFEEIDRIGDKVDEKRLAYKARTSRYKNGQYVQLSNNYGGYVTGALVIVVNRQKIKLNKEYCITVSKVSEETNGMYILVPTKYIDEKLDKQNQEKIQSLSNYRSCG